MTPSAVDAPVRVGSIRPSQVVHSFGVGALVDLPNFSVIVGGLDRWDQAHQVEITEDRLLAAVRARLGHQVAALRSMPVGEETTSPFDEWARIGVPVTVFPRWLRCTACHRLFPISTGALRLEENPYKPDRVRYTHAQCERSRRPAPAVPARFVTGCPRGHLDEFPWIEYCHADVPRCANPTLQVNDIGTGGRATDLQVRCLGAGCDARTTLAKAFGPAAPAVMPRCRGRHPHLGTISHDCPEQLRTLVLGASNLWFSDSVSVLSLPVGGGSLAQLVYDNWGELKEMPVKEVLVYALAQKPALAAIFAGHDVDAVWAAAETRLAAGHDEPATPDVRGPEWQALVHGSTGSASPHFDAEPVDAPARHATVLAGVTLAHRLREVKALCGFTRIASPEPDEPGHTAPLTAASPGWVPAVENRGEGIFLRLAEPVVQAWEDRVRGSEPIGALVDAHRRWRIARQLEPGDGWPGDRFVLLHSLAHALINELAIRCGYSSSSIRERIYSREPGDGLEPMAGILLYTAAPDAEGTLGGLVSLGEASKLGDLVSAAIDRARLCSSDPLCAEHHASPGEEALHNAACHACLFVSETSCERGNRYLDRSVLVDTFAHGGIELFGS